MVKLPKAIPAAGLRGDDAMQLSWTIAQGAREIAAGKGLDLDEVLAEADALLRGTPSEDPRRP